MCRSVRGHLPVVQARSDKTGLRGRTGSRAEKRSYLFYVAGVLLVVDWLPCWFLSNPAAARALTYLGWATWLLGTLLIFLSIAVLRSRGRPQNGKDWTHTTIIVETGIYAVVRHPLYLGWLLMYPAAILISQHWLTAVVGIPGMACMYAVSRQEDRYLVEKFGDRYERYMQSVPAMNLLAGLANRLRRSKGR